MEQLRLSTRERWLEAIPVEHREKAQAALAAAFGSTPSVELRAVGGGASGALIHRFDVGGRPYLMRIEARRDRLRNPHQYTCMQAAAEAGIAPPLRHLDAAAGVAIMDFVPSRPLTGYANGPARLAHDLGTLIARLQSTTSFPTFVDYLGVLDRLLERVRVSAMFVDGLLDPHREGFERIREAYAWDPASHASSHNDPNPRNIIYDGERLWLVDWETAYRNDPLTDVAILADNVAPTPDLEDALLQGWLGRAPDRALRARLVLMRSLTRLYYAGLLLVGFAAVPRAAPDDDLTALTPAAFGAAVTEGRIEPGTPEAMYALAKMCLAGFLASFSAPGFDDALRAARNG